MVWHWDPPLFKGGPRAWGNPYPDWKMVAKAAGLPACPGTPMFMPRMIGLSSGGPGPGENSMPTTLTTCVS